MIKDWWNWVQFEVLGRDPWVVQLHTSGTYCIAWGINIWNAMMYQWTYSQSYVHLELKAANKNPLKTTLKSIAKPVHFYWTWVWVCLLSTSKTWRESLFRNALFCFEKHLEDRSDHTVRKMEGKIGRCADENCAYFSKTTTVEQWRLVVGSCTRLFSIFDIDCFH